jgi:maltose O-acetyltransferase
MELYRLLWCAVYYGIAQHLPASHVPGGRAGRWLRAAACRRLFSACGTDVNVESMAQFHSGRRISLGDRSGIGERAVLNGTIRIGNDVMMGPDVMMYANNHAFERTDVPMNRQGFGPERPITVEDDVWIGARAIILSGVLIGRGAVVGAGAVVTKHVPAGAVVAGNPARILRYRRPVKPEPVEALILRTRAAGDLPLSGGLAKA